MAATGYTPISLYYSTTASAVPTAGNLANGELALNIADMKLYAKNSSGTVTLLASNASTTGVDSLSFGSTGLTPSTATTGAITVAGTLNVANGGTGLTSLTANRIPYGNGTSALQSSSSFTFDGTTVSSPVVQSTNGTITTVLSYSAGNSTGIVGTTSNHSVEFRQNNTEGMRLTSTGLGIGTSSPAYKLDVSASAGMVTRFTGGTPISIYSDASTAGLYNTAGTNGFMIAPASNALYWTTNSLERMRLDSAGNLGLGVTPSAWGSNHKALDIQYLGISNTGAGTVDCSFTQNGYYNGTNWITKYTSPSKRYSISDSGFIWYNGASTTAGTAISFTQAMTLDASSRLMLGTTTASSISGTVSTLSIGGTSASVSGGIAYQTNGTVKGYHYVDSDYLYHQSISGGHLFLATNTERFRIGPAGQIGLSGANYGTSGQVLTSQGSGSAPTWATAASGAQAFIAFGSTGGY